MLDARRTLVRLLVGAARIVVFLVGAPRQIRGAMLLVVAGVVVEAVIACLAAVVVAKDPIAAGDEVIGGLMPRRREAGPIANGEVGVGHLDKHLETYWVLAIADLKGEITKEDDRALGGTFRSSRTVWLARSQCERLERGRNKRSERKSRKRKKPKLPCVCY